MSNPNLSSQNSDKACEIVSSRLIPVGPERIFRAFTEPEHLAAWWGPKGFRNTFHEFDPTPGGLWRFDMRGPDDRDYPNRSIFEVVDPKRIVFQHLEPGHRFRMTMTLNAAQGGTLLTWRMAFDSPEECERVKAYIPQCNEENFDRLEAELARMSGPDGDERDLVITRIIDVPREKPFQAWTDPDLLKQWFAPLPYTTPVVEVDVRPGGASYIVMRAPDGTDMPLRGVYLEVVENERIVSTDAYTVAWEPSEKPFFTMVVTFEDLGGRTRYTARARHWSIADRKAHEEMGFHQGWGQCADQLITLVEKL